MDHARKLTRPGTPSRTNSDGYRPRTVPETLKVIAGHKLESKGDLSMEETKQDNMQSQRIKLEAFRVIGLEIETPDLGRKVRESVRWIRERMDAAGGWESPDIHCIVPPQTIMANEPGFKLFVGLKTVSPAVPAPEGWSYMDIPEQTYVRAVFNDYLSACDDFYRNMEGNLNKLGYTSFNKQAIAFERYPDDAYDWSDDLAKQTIHIYNPLL